MLAVLRRRDFGLLWLAGLVSVAGDWVLNSALPYFVFQRTGSTLATAGMIVAELVPAVLLGAVAGVYVDRWDRRRVLLVANLLQALVVGLLLLFSDGGALWVVYVVAGLASTISSFSMPAESALLPTLVGEDELVAANALNALNNRIGRLVGLPAGAALLVAFGLSAVVVVDCLSFVAAAGLIVAVRARRRPEPNAGVEKAASALATLWVELVDGIVLVRRERSIALVFFVLGMMTYGGTMLDPVFPAWVRDVLEQGPAVYAWLMTVSAIGGIAGSLLVGSIGRHITPRELMGWGSLIAGVSLLVRFNLPNLWLAFALAALNGVTAVASSVGVDTLIQQSIPDRYRGRVFGSLGASGALLSLLGALTSGLVAGAIGIVPTLDIASALVLLAGLVVLAVYSPKRRRAESVVQVAAGD
jgi:MFS family permease